MAGGGGRNGQRLLGHPPRFQEAREVAAAAKAGNAQLDGPRPRLPVPLTIAVTLGQTVLVILPPFGRTLRLLQIGL